MHAFLQGAGDPRQAEDARYVGGIAHLTSADTLRWSEQTPALVPGPPGSGDDLGLYSGSTFFHEGIFYLFYTGRCSAEDGRVERLRLATSSDGVHFARREETVVEADVRYYEARPLDSPDGTVNWRDPDVTWCAEEGRFYLVCCARSADHQGALGLARSEDLLHWEVLPPLWVNPRSNMMECPHWVRVDGRYAVCYSQGTGWLTAQGRRETPAELQEDGVYCVTAPGVGGPWSDGDRRALAGVPHWRHKPYAGAPLHLGEETLLSYRLHGSAGYAPFKRVVATEGGLHLAWNPRLEAALSDPMPVTPESDAAPGVGYRFSLARTCGRDGVVSGRLRREGAERAGLVFRADEWGWKGMFVACNFAAGTVEYGTCADPAAAGWRYVPGLAEQTEVEVKLLLAEDIIELFLDDRLALSTCVAACGDDLGHDRLGIVDVGGAAAWEGLRWEALSLSDGRAMW